MPSDVQTPDWSEVAASNNVTPPAGWPEGQAPSTVNDCAREMMGALKRDWDRNHATVTSGGTSSAFTLTYTVAPPAYVNGLSFRFKAHAAPAASATMAPGGLAAKTINVMTSTGLAALGGGEWQTNHHVELEYDSGADVLVLIGSSLPSSITGNFAASQQSTPNMTVLVGKGTIENYATGALTSIAAQNTATFTAPGANSRNDIVYIDDVTGIVGVVTGTPGVSPTDPAVLPGKRPVARVRLTASTTSIPNSLIDDIRQLPSVQPFPTGFLTGMNLSNDSGSPNTVLDISAGSCRNSADTANIVVGSAYTKSTSAWAVGSGNGGLDTGSIAASTWYHVHAMLRPDTGVTDYCFSLSATTPATGGAIPAAYTAFRRIGSFFMNGSTQISAFVQQGAGVNREFWWASPAPDFDVANPGTAAVLRTLLTPLGVRVKAIMNAGNFAQSAVNGGLYLSDPATTDVAPPTLTAAANSAGGMTVAASTSGTWAFTQAQIWTNTSSQIRTRAPASGASMRISVSTLGWQESL